MSQNKPYHVVSIQPDGHSERVNVGSSGGVLTSSGTDTAPTFTNNNTAGCLVSRDSGLGSLSVATNTWTSATLSTVATGTHNEDSNWNTDTYTCPADGLYDFFYTTRFQLLGITTGDWGQVRFFINETTDKATTTVGMFAGLQTSISSTLSCVSMSAGDRVTPQVRHGSSGSLNLLADTATNQQMWFFSAKYRGV